MGVLVREDRFFAVTATLTPSAVTAAATAEQTFTVTGLKTTDSVVVTKPAAQAVIGIAGARVSAADTLAITFINPTATTQTATATEVYQIFVYRPELLRTNAKGD